MQTMFIVCILLQMIAKLPTYVLKIRVPTSGEQ